MNKHYSITLAFLLTCLMASAQVPTNQDCLGAIPVCQYIFVQPNAYSGTGNYPSEINPALSCLNQGEKNDVWYVFTVQTPGQLSFTIFTNNPGDDYDWVLFDLTNSTCADIFVNPSLEKSCNYSGIPGNTGMNGLPGPQNNPTLAVLPGQTYVLNISNFSSNQSGYTLNFTASTAAIFDTIPPVMASVSPLACPVDSILVTFSENIQCSSVQLTDFTLTNPSGGNVPLASVSTPNCISGADYSNTYTLYFSPPLSVSGNYTISLVDTVLDVCSNVGIFPANKVVNVAVDTITLTTSADTTVCAGTAVTLTANATGGNNITYVWSNGISSQSNTVTPTQTTNYTVSSSNECGSTATSSVTVNVITQHPSITASNDTSICSGTPVTLSATASGGTGNYTYTWNGTTPGITYTVSPTQTTTYTVVVMDECNFTDTDLVVVNVVTEPALSFSFNDSLCLGETCTILYTGTNISGTTYNWDFDSPESQTGSGIGPYNIVWNAVGVHQVIFNASVTGCFNKSDTLLVNEKSCDVVVPNVFTPNGDGTNDLFVVKGLDSYSNSHMLIYDRWGTIILDNDNYKNDWTASGNPDGVYYYILSVTGFETFKGTVTVLRK